MYCSQCGRFLSDGVAFCPYCGETAENRPVSAEESVFAEPAYPCEAPVRNKGLSTGKIGLLIAALIVAGLIVIVMSGSDSEGKSYALGLADGTVTNAEDYCCAVPGSGFTEEGVTIATMGYVENDRPSFVQKNALRITLSDDIGNRYTQYVWSFTDLYTDASSTPITKDEGYITLYGTGFHPYRVDVTCAKGSDTAKYSFVFEIRHYGAFKWKYDNNSYSLDVSIGNSDYLKYHSLSAGGRNPVDWRKCTDFVVIEDNVKAVSASLETLMKKTYGTDYTQQEYADFILGFVQGAFGYYTDPVLYRSNEYFTYPVETLCHMGGDCEDTSILCAALYTAAGFDSAVLILPGHAMVGVALDDYRDYSGNYRSCEVLSLKVGDKTYYAGETTIDSQQHAGISGGKSQEGRFYSWYIGKGIVGQGSYTFYPVKVTA